MGWDGMDVAGMIKESEITPSSSGSLARALTSRPSGNGGTGELLHATARNLLLRLNTQTPSGIPWTTTF